MKKKWFTILLLCIGSLSMGSCLDKLFGDEDDDDDGLSLFCGSVLPNGYHCISPLAGSKYLTNFHIPELYGIWYSEGYEFCVEYNGDGTGKITAIASGLHSGSVTNIKWGVMVDSDGSYSESDGNGSVRVIHEGISKAVDPQIAMLTFKIPTKQFYGFDLVRAQSCEAVGAASNTGKVTFWLGADSGCGTVTVKISNGQQGSITHYYSSMPSCGASGSANFTLPTGKYSFTASCSEHKWAGDFTVDKDACHPLKLGLSN